MNRVDRNYSIALLQLRTELSYRKNLEKLIAYIKNNQDKSLIVAPEVYLTGFDYDNFEEVASFYDIAIEAILPLISNQILLLTLIKKDRGEFVNQATVIYNHKIVYTQNKYKLFKLGNEDKFFKRGNIEDIKPFTINGIKYAVIICFELRFKELWRKIEGVDIVIIPSMWGLSRRVHLEVLSEALAIMNQCFVALCNSANSDMAKSSAIIYPWGEVIKDNRLNLITHTIDLREVKRVRRLVSIN